MAVNLVESLGDINKLGGFGMAFGATPGLAGQGPERIRAVLGNVGSFLRQFQANQWVFPQMAQAFGMTADQARALLESLPRLNQAESALQQNRIKLEERYRNQQLASGRVLGQFVNSLKALLLEVLTPLLPVVERLTIWLDFARKQLVAVKDVLPGPAKDLLKGVAAVGLGYMALSGIFKLFGAFRAGGGLLHLLGRMVGFGGAAAAAGGGGVVTGATGVASRVALQALGRSVVMAFAADTATVSTLGATIIGAMTAGLPLLVLGTAAYLVYKQLEAKANLRKQAEQMADERAGWGARYAAQTSRQMYAELFTEGRRGAGAFDAFSQSLEQAFGPGGVVGQEIKRRQLTPEEGLRMEQEARDTLLRRQRTNELMLANVPMTPAAQQQMREEQRQIIALLAQISALMRANNEIYAQMQRDSKDINKDLKQKMVDEADAFDPLGIRNLAGPRPDPRLPTPIQAMQWVHMTR